MKKHSEKTQSASVMQKIEDKGLAILPGAFAPLSFVVLASSHPGFAASFVEEAQALPPEDAALAARASLAGWRAAVAELQVALARDALVARPVDSAALPADEPELPLGDSFPDGSVERREPDLVPDWPGRLADDSPVASLLARAVRHAELERGQRQVVRDAGQAHVQ